MADHDEIEVLPAVVENVDAELQVGPEPGTLFRTDDPVEIIARATEVARVLSEVLKAQQLTSRINNKDYVRVEGWTLCGTMLGVFPVVEWTRQTQDGWEARVEARTKDGAIVGAAEAECLRTEKEWGPNPSKGRPKDDYALRSMAQTRAISKALRAPLGFIVSLAGFEATPAEEMAFLEEKEIRPFNPDTDLIPGAISGQDAPRIIADALVELEPTVDWPILIHDIVRAHYEHAGTEDWRELLPNDQKDFWRRLSNATFKMQEKSPPGTMPPIKEQDIIECVSYAFGGMFLADIPHVDTPVEEDDIPFGE